MPSPKPPALSVHSKILPETSSAYEKILQWPLPFLLGIGLIFGL